MKVSGVTPCFAGVDHDGGAVGVVAADVDDVVAAEALEADPDVGLDVLDEVADVDGAVGVGECGGDEDLTRRAWVLQQENGTRIIVVEGAGKSRKPSSGASPPSSIRSAIFFDSAGRLRDISAPAGRT